MKCPCCKRGRHCLLCADRGEVSRADIKKLGRAIDAQMDEQQKLLTNERSTLATLREMGRDVQIRMQVRLGILDALSDAVDELYGLVDSEAIAA